MTIEERRIEGVSILIVEDEYIIAMNLKECLESFGYTVLDIVDSAEKAIEHAAEQRPDLVLMDICLKGEVNGIEAAERIWKQWRIPVIYVTGYSDRSTVERALLNFPFGYIIKPISESNMHSAIQETLVRSLG